MTSAEVQPTLRTAWESIAEEARLAASGGAAALALSGRGNLALVALFLAFAAGPLAGTVSVLSLAAVALRWGTTSLSEIAGDAAVLGAPVRVGPWLAAASVACAGGALLLAAASVPGRASPSLRLARDSGPRELAARLALGATAGSVIAGPAGAPHLPVALVGLAVSAALAAVAGRVSISSEAARPARFFAVFLGLVAVVLGASR